MSESAKTLNTSDRSSLSLSLSLSAQSSQLAESSAIKISESERKIRNSHIKLFGTDLILDRDLFFRTGVVRFDRPIIDEKTYLFAQKFLKNGPGE